MAAWLTPTHHWECPNCNVTQVTHSNKPHTPFHVCRGLRGLNAPLVLEGTRCKVEAEERGDWVGRDVVQTDAEGQPVMAIVTTREHGQDRAVLAPCAMGGVV